MESTSTSERSDQDVYAGSEAQAAAMEEIRSISVITQAAAMEEIRSISLITQAAAMEEIRSISVITQAAAMEEIRSISVITQAAAMEEIRSTSVVTEVDVAATTHDAGYVQLQVLEEVDHQPAPCCINVDASCTDVATDVAACASSASNRSSTSSTSSRYCRICMDVETVEAGHDGDPILELGCKCNGGLGLAHKSCAITWFSAKRSRSVAYEQLKCEICRCDLSPAVSLIVCQHSSTVRITILGSQFPDPMSLQITQVSVSSSNNTIRRNHRLRKPLTVAKILGVLVLLAIVVFHFFIQAHKQNS